MEGDSDSSSSHVQTRQQYQRASADEARHKIQDILKPQKGSKQYHAHQSVRTHMLKQHSTLAVRDLNISPEASQKLKRVSKHLENALPYSPNMSPQAKRFEFVFVSVTKVSIFFYMYVAANFDPQLHLSAPMLLYSDSPTSICITLTNSDFFPVQESIVPADPQLRRAFEDFARTLCHH
jgi:hypothetical protein